MREISGLMRRAPTQQIARDYGIAISSALRIDRWALSEEMPESQITPILFLPQRILQC